MASRALQLPPTPADLAVERALARRARTVEQRSLRVVTLLADERITLGLCALLWAYCRFGRRDDDARRCGDTIAVSGVIAALLPHALKRLVDRERPNRKIAHGIVHGVARAGNKWDSFPSGHAMHLGALAAAVSGFASPPGRAAIWAGAAALASTRLLLLAHYPTDVMAGLALGGAIGRATARLVNGAEERGAMRWGARPR